MLDDALRRQRTRGKSTPDLLRQRAGDLSDAPDVVVRPADHDDVQAVLDYAQQHRIAVVPFGGGTAVTGGLAPDRDGFAGVISLDLGRMRSLLALDPVSSTATLGPGLRGPEAEALLAEHGLMLGHFPQSFEFATIGGFAATRSSGQSSAGYGRFDAMVVGLRAATPKGEVRLGGTSPSNASGPDLRELFLGSEGAFGVITEVTVRVRPLPEVKEYEGWQWSSFAAGADAMRALAQGDLMPTVLRLSDENETAINLARPDAIGGDGAGGCLMIVGYEGTPAAVAAKKAAVTAALTELGGTALGAEPGDAWAAGRFNAPYLRDSLLDVGVIVETLETVTFWSNRERLYTAVKSALEAELGEGTMVLCHISHVYATGCSLYFTVAASGGGRPARALAQGQGRCQRRDRRQRRVHHPPPRGRHRPPRLAGAGDRRGRRRRTPCGEAGARPRRHPQPGSPDPVSRAFTFLVNPNSGGGAAPKVVVPLARRLREAGADTEVSYTSSPSVVPDLVKAAVADGRVIVSVGGDGMLSSVAGAVVDAGGELAVIPAGRGNDFARMLEVPTDEAAQVALLLDGTPTPVDLLSVGMPGRPTSLVAGSVYAGVDARIAQIVDRSHWLPKALQYPIASVRGLATYRPLDAHRRRRRRHLDRTARPTWSSRTRATTARAWRSPPTPPSTTASST